VSQVSLYLEQIDEATAKRIALPAAWLLAPADRQIAFRAGRYCAMRALEQLGLSGACPAVNDNNAPAWPQGTVGSITHVMSLVSAAAAPSSVQRHRHRHRADHVPRSRADDRLPRGDQF
jgi:4'-phosphopantetheinyl transferase EntD